MTSSEQRLSEARRQHTEAILARHPSELFQRLPMLFGFWLRPDVLAMHSRVRKRFRLLPPDR